MKPHKKPGPVAKPLAERFWCKARIGQEGECWPWQAYRHPDGYGVFQQTVDGKPTPSKAHRVAWALANGPIPPDLCVCHTCDNPPCVNPKHLFLGTHDDNMADRDAKGRVAHKLSQDDIAFAVEWRAAGWSFSQLGHALGVHRTAVSYHWTRHRP